MIDPALYERHPSDPTLGTALIVAIVLLASAIIVAML